MTDQDWTPPGPGSWRQDRAHLPVCVTPLIREIYPEPMLRGFAEAFAPWGVLLDTVRLEFVNGFPYAQAIPFDAPGPDGPLSPDEIAAEIERRAGLAAAAFEDRIWREALRYWDDEVKPAAVARHRELADVDLSSLDDEGLRAHLHACVEHLADMWFQHHRFNGMAIVPVGDFVLHAAEWSGRPPVPLFAVFDGWSPVSSLVPPELAEAVDAIEADEAAKAVLDRDTEPADRLAELRELVPAVDAYMRANGHKIAAGFDLTNPTIGERPDIVIDRIRAALERAGTNPREASDRLAGEIRADVPEEHRAEFDEMLAEARLVYRLRDERGIYSDTQAVGLMRLALIELGRRLVRQGSINFMYDALDVTSAEIDALLDEASHPTADELSGRVAARKAASEAGAPRYLGPKPDPPPPLDDLPPPLARVMGALGFYLEGVGGEVDSPMGDADVVIGIGGGPGTYEGRARIVRKFADLFDVEEGEVLVASATGESFNAFLAIVGAIVTDHGSFASHAAIIGREMGIPTVVGTVDATSRIPRGARVRVDGGSGTVTVIES
jgi:phosphohistidine swiveling domain-containing protein